MMGSERSSSSSKSPLHNFNLPDGLRWGNQKFLRCMKVNSNGQNSAIERKPSQLGSSVTTNSYFNNNGFVRSKNDDVFASYYCNFEDDRKKRESWVDGVMLPVEKRMRIEGDDNHDGIAEVREKVILDLQTAADKMKDAILKRDCLDDDMAAEKWNLRTRRGVGGGGSGGGGKNLSLDVMRSNNVEALMVSPLRMVEGEATQRLRSGGTSVAAVGVPVGGAPSVEKKRGKFSVALTRREIEEDFIAMVRRRPPRRPMKRPKYIQKQLDCLRLSREIEEDFIDMVRRRPPRRPMKMPKYIHKQLDTLFPGVWLTEITADMYKVPETQ